LNITDVGHVRGEKTGRGDDRRGDGHTLGDGFGGIAHRIQVGHNLTGFLGFFIILALPGHFSDTVGVIRNGAEGVHGNVVAGVAEHTDTNHGHCIEHVNRQV